VIYVFPADIWEESVGEYRRREDAKENVLKKIYGEMRRPGIGGRVRRAKIEKMVGDYYRMAG